MRIAFFVNALKKEATDSTTIRLAMEATNRGHQTWFIEADDFLLDENDCVMATARSVPRNRYRSTAVYLEELRGKKAANKRIKFTNLDVLFLRGDPVPESRERRWTKDVG
ncbi:MAG: glutathione synthase, partial [Cyanobacteria bacterium HKST-UBA01]|nr:glutathione synthase [Cyanobacteria bacterium HKST-UBA01]